METKDKLKNNESFRHFQDLVKQIISVPKEKIKQSEILSKKEKNNKKMVKN
jgi:hypothetical protein